MPYKLEKMEAWLKVPVNRFELNLLNKILKKEKKNLKIFIQEVIKNKLTSVTLIF